MPATDLNSTQSTIPHLLFSFKAVWIGSLEFRNFCAVKMAFLASPVSS
jgi:hypothetical protein